MQQYIFKSIYYKIINIGKHKNEAWYPPAVPGSYPAEPHNDVTHYDLVSLMRAFDDAGAYWIGIKKENNKACWLTFEFCGPRGFPKRGFTLAKRDVELHSPQIYQVGAQFKDVDNLTCWM